MKLNDFIFERLPRGYSDTNKVYMERLRELADMLAEEIEATYELKEKQATKKET